MPGETSAKQAHRVEHFGHEHEPIIVIDGFTGCIAELAAKGRQQRYAPVPGYPGMRSPLTPSYLALGEPLFGKLLAQHFGLTGRFRAESCSFSLITIPPDALSQAQRRPHYDNAVSNLIALVHYTQGPETGGTAFYRHRRTGFEAITPERSAVFNAAERTDDAEFDALPPRYYYGDSERYELIGEIEARPDRLIAYRGRQLHSGVIPQPPTRKMRFADARLTINTFLIGEV